MPLVKKTNAEPVATYTRKRNRDCPDLILGLEDASAMTRRWSARDLVNCQGASAALIDCLKCEDDPSVRDVILTTLTRLGDASAITGLVDCLRSEDAALRNAVIEAMKLLPNEVAPIIHGLLEDADPDVRIFTVNVLESLRHPDVESWLIDVINTDAHINVCATAVDLLSEVGTTAALEPLERLKARFADAPYIQFAADLALRRIHEG
jgi:HEAT repeat protein